MLWIYRIDKALSLKINVVKCVVTVITTNKLDRKNKNKAKTAWVLGVILQKTSKSNMVVEQISEGMKKLTQC